MLSHGNISSVIPALTERITITDKDYHLSYLPMAHILERLLVISYYFFGSKIGISCGNILKLKEDLSILKPTIFVSVPRLYNKFYDAIKLKFSQKNALTRKLINAGVKAKLENLKNKNDFKHAFYDTLVFNKTKNVLGGRVKYLITGSAPIHPDVLNFLKICFSAPIAEGYG